MSVMSKTSHIFAYGYRRTSAQMEPLGAGKRVYVDHDRKRRDRALMLSDLRRGDVVRVLYLRDLGGSPVADRIWRERIEAKGATVEIHRPEKPSRPAHRPRSVFDPTPEQAEKIRAVWLDETRSLADRCQAVADVYGRKVSRQVLYHHFGKPGTPK